MRRIGTLHDLLEALERGERPRGTFGPCPEPGTARSVGVTRVQIRTAVGSGSPEATPCWK